MPTEMYTNVYMEKVFHLSPLCIFVHRKNVSCLSKCIFIMDICLKFLSYVPFLCETISYALWKNKVNLLNVKIWSMVFDTNYYYTTTVKYLRSRKRRLYYFINLLFLAKSNLLTISLKWGIKATLLFTLLHYTWKLPKLQKKKKGVPCNHFPFWHLERCFLAKSALFHYSWSKAARQCFLLKC